MDQLVRVLRDLVEDLKRDYIDASSDLFIRARSEIFSRFYRVLPLTPVKPGSAGDFIFVDAGFKSYQLDVAMIIPMQIGGLYRDGNGNLANVRELTDKPAVDTIILYTSRRRRGSGFEFSAKVKCLDKTLLFGERGRCEEISIELNRLLRGIAGTDKKMRTSRFFVKLAKYLEGLLELAYAIKLRRALREELGLNPMVVLDGSLIKWFSVKRRGIDFDGLDILSILLDNEPGKVVQELDNVFGLAKTTKFTTIARSYGLFLSRKDRGVMGRGFYTIIDQKGVEHVREKLEELLEGYAATDFVMETIKLFNRVIYDIHGVYVVRFPLTSDYSNVFILDTYTRGEVVGFKDHKLRVDYEQISRVNEKLNRAVPSLYTYRSRIYGEPPYGYMEVDSVVRFGKDLSNTVEQLLIGVMGSSGDASLQPLIQAFSSTIRMRYGYR